MSAAPHLIPGARRGLRLGAAPLLDSLVVDGLPDAFNGIHMGLTAERLAEKCSISRREQDEFTCASHSKAAAAIRAGLFQPEIIPVAVSQKERQPLIFSQDEHPRPDCSIEALYRLKPDFKPGGTVTAGNASGLTTARQPWWS